MSSSNFPKFDRNPNTGGVAARARIEDLVPALQTVLHESSHPSAVILPLVQREQ